MGAIASRRESSAARVRPGGTEAARLLRRFGSPLYVYDLAEIERCYRRFRAAFPYEPLDCHFAIVCNKNPVLVRFLLELGAGVHANTPGDAYAALAAGVPAERIVYSGANLTAADFDFVLGHGIALNVDSLDQLHDVARRGGTNPIGLRVLVDEPQKRSRIGIALHELSEAAAVARTGGLRLVGVHMYAGTNTRRASRFVETLDVLLAASDALPDLEYVDAGGGYGVGYREVERDLDLATVGAAIAERMKAVSARRGRTIRLLLEPGRILVATSGTLLTTVVAVKERGGRRFVGVDTTVGNLAAPSVYHGYHRVEALASRGPLLAIPTDVCGNTTHSGDFLARDARLPALRRGDIVALRDVGAYAYAMSSHFLNRPRPAEVVLVGGRALLTTRRETFADLLALQVPASVS
jgi:diaminopimelate decarboxylase